MTTGRWPKKCDKCGTAYDVREWEALPYVGILRPAFSGMPIDMELRTCTKCASNIYQATIHESDVIVVGERK